LSIIFGELHWEVLISIKIGSELFFQNALFSIRRSYTGEQKKTLAFERKRKYKLGGKLSSAT